MGMRCGVLGDPIAHSLSPTLHRAGYSELGLDWSYQPVQVDEVSLAAFLAGLDSSWRGLSLTMPLKRRVMSLLDTVTDRARLGGAANTVVLESDGSRWGDNTDIPGAVAAIRERYGAPLRSATLLGGGATAASLGLALCELGVRSIVVLARTAARAEQTRRVIAEHPAAPQVRVADLATSAVTGDVVASTVPATAQDEGLLARCASVPVVFEALYDPWPTPLAASATDSGRVLVAGMDLLAHQAALQFELFTGIAAPLAQMRAAGELALAAR